MNARVYTAVLGGVFLKARWSKTMTEGAVSKDGGLPQETVSYFSVSDHGVNALKINRLIF
jgi:hypothetical protein